MRVHTNRLDILREMKIANILANDQIVRTIDSGENGFTNTGLTNLLYIVMEYIPNQIFDLIKLSRNVGEEGGRMFLRQMVDCLDYMHEQKGVAHRDIKLENMLLTSDLTIKFADFGFATQDGIEKLSQFRGTKTYMAPEIKEGKVYNGKQVDIFSIGVVLFIMVRGIYPFTEATKNDQFYELVLNDKLDAYWGRVDRAN